MSARLDRMYDLLPGVHRLRDAERGYSLRALLGVINKQANILEDDISRLYDNWFMETCDDWVVPYLGDLIGYRTVHDAGEPQPEDTLEGRRENKILTPRREVGNTVAMRRRKGTLLVLAELADDVAGWPARAVEFYKLLGWTQHLDHLRLTRAHVTEIRDPNALDLLDGAFEACARTVDVRRIASHRSIGRYNIPSVGVFVWRLKTYPVTRTPAFRLEEPHCFTFSVLGNDTQLYRKPQPGTKHVEAQANFPVSIRRRAFQRTVRWRPYEARASDTLYGEGKSLAIYAPDWPVRGAPQPIPSEMIVPADLSNWHYRAQRSTVGVDPVLGRMVFPTGHFPKQAVWVNYRYAFSADIGGGEYTRPLIQPSPNDVSRFQFPDFVNPTSLVTHLRNEEHQVTKYLRSRFAPSTVSKIDAYQGPEPPAQELLNALIEELNRLLSDSGLYDKDRFVGIDLPDEVQRLLAGNASGPLLNRLNRLLLEAAYPDLIALSYVLYQVGKDAHEKLNDALDLWRKAKPRYSIIEFIDSASYNEPVDIELSPYQALQIRAANRTRPILRLPEFMTDRPNAFGVKGGNGSRFTIDGLLVTGRGIAIEGRDPEDPEAPVGDLCEVTIRHSTLVPGWGLRPNCDPTQPNEPSLELINVRAKVEIEHSIVGSIEVVADEVLTDPVEIAISDSIIDATRLERAAFGAPDLPLGFARLSIVRTTVLGETNVHAIALAENAIFMSVVRVARRQEGCMRFCYVPPGSRTPRRHHCQPDLAKDAVNEWVPILEEPEKSAAKVREELRVRPILNSIRYGRPAYCQLALDCAVEIKRSADDESEMGVFHDLFEPQRVANLRVRLDEFTPAGMEAGILFAD